MTEITSRLSTALADRYRIEREIGSGGMAIVYLAQDLKHERRVAVKVLRPELAEALGPDRFLREIKIAAGLSHPHILPVHDSGKADGFLYYVMPYVEGETLRDRLNREGQLPIDEALQLTREIADALGSAHSRGVIHRDIKPENILLEEGHAVVADFGIARAVTAAGGDRLTETGLVVGTPAYMSPEQAGGDAVDGRSDLYSLGCVLYELLAGQPPFTGASAAALVRQHMTAEPTPVDILRPSVPKFVSNALTAALAKTPADRFQAPQFADALTTPIHVEDAPARRPRASIVGFGLLGVLIVAFLGWWFLAGLGGPTDRFDQPMRIAVLPFENLSSSEDDEYFSDGITRDVNAGLSKLRNATVIAHGSARRSAAADKGYRAIADELKVEFIVDGSVRRSDGRVHLNVSLIDPESGVQLWTDVFDCDATASDIFQSEREVVRQIAAALDIEAATETNQLVVTPTASTEAYDAYLLGRFFWNKRTESDIQTGLAYFQQAVALDPEYSAAHVGIADTWIFRGWYSVLAPTETFPKAKEAVVNALRFDETLAEAHTSRAHIYLEYDYDWESAEREYLRAIELDPTYPTAHHWYGGYLSAMGRHEEALAQAEAARELDPLSSIINTWVGLRHYFAGRHEVAIQEYERALDLNPRFAPGQWHLGWALEQTGRFDEAIAAAREAIDISGGNPLYLASLGHAYATAGDEARAREVLEQLAQEATSRHVSAYHTAVIYVALGEADEAFRLLDLALDERSPWIGYMAVDPRLDELQADPRLDALLRRANLVS